MMPPDPEEQLQQLRTTHQHTVDSLKSTLERLEAKVRERQAAPAISKTSASQKLKAFFKEPRSWLEVFAFILLALVAIYVLQQIAAMNGTLAEIRKQSSSAAETAAAAKRSADIAFLQLKNINAADLHFTTGVIRDHGSDFVWLNVENTGRATAPAVHGTETVSIEELPSRRKLQPDVVLQLDSETAKPVAAAQPTSFRKVYAVSGLDAGVIRDVTQVKKIVRLDGVYSWDDGFGDKMDSHFCWDLIASNPDAETPAYAQYDCDSSEDRIKQAVREKKTADEQTSQ